MKQADNVVKVVMLEEGHATIGKCNMCARRIINDPFEFWCAETRLVGGKYFCGGCLIELVPIIKEVEEAFKEVRQEAEKQGNFYSIDQASGRLVVNNG
jgi:hypothetical protein